MAGNKKMFNSNNFYQKTFAMFGKKIVILFRKKSTLDIAQIISKSIFFVRYLQPVKYKVG